ncbi:MAG: hypothetical protein H0V17_17465, partial [Deltaproteobacteria bacterium]|nr:hypothetical protein [Deltaproteobacteria bacterium]
MANQESTAINDLIHLAQGRRLDRQSENPVPEVYVPAARPRPLNAPAPARIASGTNPPPIAQPQHPIAQPQAAHTPITPPPPQVAAQPAKYMLPIVDKDEEQTELWSSHANVDTRPAVPAIPPHSATVIAQPATLRP